MFGTKDPPGVCILHVHSNRSLITQKLANKKSFNILKSFSIKGIGIESKGSVVAPVYVNKCSLKIVIRKHLRIEIAD